MFRVIEVDFMIRFGSDGHLLFGSSSEFIIYLKSDKYSIIQVSSIVESTTL